MYLDNNTLQLIYDLEYDNSSDNHVRSLDNRNKKIYPLLCPPFEWGQWIEHKILILGHKKKCYYGSVNFQNTGNTDNIYTVCYNTCSSSRKCDLTFNKAIYSFPMNEQGIIRIRCKSISLPIIGTGSAIFNS